MVHSKEWASLEDERAKAAGLLMVGGLLEFLRRGPLDAEMQGYFGIASHRA